VSGGKRLYGGGGRYPSSVTGGRVPVTAAKPPTPDRRTPTPDRRAAGGVGTSDFDDFTARLESELLADLNGGK